MKVGTTVQTGTKTLLLGGWDRVTGLHCFVSSNIQEEGWVKLLHGQENDPIQSLLCSLATPASDLEIEGRTQPCRRHFGLRAKLASMNEKHKLSFGFHGVG